MRRATSLAVLTLLTLPLLLRGQAADGLRPATTVLLQDEGAAQGRVKTLNFTGAGVSCSASGIVGTCNVSGGGGGSANTVSATVDFGAGNTEATVVVTGQAWVSSSSVIVCAPTLMATSDRTDGMEDAAIEGLVVAPYARVAGTGFSILAHPMQGRAVGKYLIHCTGA